MAASLSGTEASPSLIEPSDTSLRSSTNVAVKISAPAHSNDPPTKPAVQPAAVQPVDRFGKMRLLWQNVALLVIVAAIVAYAAFSAVTLLMSPSIVYALAHVAPVEPCISVSSDEIRNGSAVYHTVNLRDVLASLRHHMRKGTGHGSLQGISAQYLEQHRVCLALVNMIHAPGDASNVMVMYNMRIVGVSKDQVLRTTERSVLCTNVYTTRRFQDVIVEFEDEKGTRFEMVVSGVAAQTLQQIHEVQSGEGHCMDTNVEAQLERLRRLVVGISDSVFAYSMHPELGSSQGRRAISDK